MKKVLSIFLLLMSTIAVGQPEKKYSLPELLQEGRLNIVNRDVKVIDSLNYPYIRVSEHQSEGIIWLPINDFKSGQVTIEMRGKNILQKSFIGIAFHGQNDTTYDAVYCRPFNFFAADSVRKIHAIQYVAHPTYTWKKLRDERNGLYEKVITDPPDPDGWFTMRLVINKTTIKAYINTNAQPSLVIEKLSDYQSGRIGIFTGASSGGDFRNIYIRDSGK